MKILLTTLNSKYIHSNLALRYLKGYCHALDHDIQVREFTINDQMESVIGEIWGEGPDTIGFSCYIWNIRETLRMIDTIKKVLPNTLVLLGGPEVSFDGCEIMKKNPGVDFVIKGEGEQTFKELLDGLSGKCSLEEIKGLIYRREGEIFENGDRPLISSLDTLPFPYPEGFEGLQNKIIYYETSRGCPYNCQYCLSSTIRGVRYLSMDRIRQDVKLFIEQGVKQVKLVDRTFNCHPDRAREIFSYIMSLGGETNFHCEMAGDIIDKDMLDLLSKAPPGLFQFEIGVQSTRPDTLDAIHRNTDFDRLAANVKHLKLNNHIHLHLDLIAGLPKEDYNSFGRSFDDVYGLKPHRIQLGFLKLLKGSALRERSSEYGYVYTEYPPYEVLGNKDIGYKELLRLKRIEDLVEKYYNTHRYDFSLEYLIELCSGSAFAFFEEFCDFWEARQLFRISHNSMKLYEFLFEFGQELGGVEENLLRNLVRFDYCLQEKPSRYPEGVEGKRPFGFQSQVNEFFKDPQNIHRYFSHMNEFTSKQVARKAHIEFFDYNLLQPLGPGQYPYMDTAVLFDYEVPSTLLGKSKYYAVSLKPRE